jgi:hypothetical protein
LLIGGNEVEVGSTAADLNLIPKLISFTLLKKRVSAPRNGVETRSILQHFQLRVAQLKMLQDLNKATLNGRPKLQSAASQNLRL